MSRVWSSTLHLAIVAVVVYCTAPEIAQARITRLEITRVESPAFGGTSFDRVGQYERLIGRAYGEVDPKHALNAIICAPHPRGVPQARHRHRRAHSLPAHAHPTSRTLSDLADVPR
jgi:hypothetical protein